MYDNSTTTASTGAPFVNVQPVPPPPEPPTPLEPQEQDVKQIRVLRLGDSVYSLDKLGTVEDFTERVEGFYKEKFATLRRDLTEVVARESEYETTHQLERLQRMNSQNDVTIPQQLYNKLCWYDDRKGEVLEVKMVEYNVYTVRGTMRALANLSTPMMEWMAEQEDYNEENRNRTVILDMKYNPQFTMPVGFSDRLGKAFALGGYSTFHSYRADGRFCLGKSQYSTFKALSPEEMEQGFGHINMFSLARDTANDPTVDYSVRLKDVIKPELITNLRRDAWTQQT